MKTDLAEFISHSRPTLGDEEKAAVAEVMASGQIAEGEKVHLFEREMSQYIGVQGAVAVNSGSAALHLALLSLKVGAGDQVIIPVYTCTAILNAVCYVKAEPVLVDVDPHSYNLEPAKAKKALTKKTKAIIVPHMFGQAADLAELSALGVPLIEDCAQALGAGYQDKKVGGFGVLSVYSFYATKMITTGEGGMVTSNQADLLTTVRDLRHYDQNESYKIRYNYKMTDIAAAMGRVQLGKLPQMLARRKQIAQMYLDNLGGLDFGLPHIYADREHVFYRFVILVSGGLEEKINQLRKMGIDCTRPVYKPLHHYLSQSGFPVAQAVWEQALSLPIYPTLRDEQIRYIIRSVQGV
ncbi:MAG: DegT/DnrJ/EryC1/StrS family aminotransferase [Candidatus Schekmanbacteria bacterium]|nr:DegT/DnrJ/EryC1/StrS family aminotransferase [Candidatus Schekmanbacteria bacterium]